MAELQARLQTLTEEYTKLQSEMSKSVQARQKLEAQKQENVGVEEEFKNLKDGERIYKLVGTVLMEQDRAEAESTVKGRLEFIGKEIERQEATLKEMQEKLDKKRGEIIQVQSAAQAAGGGQPAGKGKAAATG